MSKTITIVAGIDVAKAKLDVAIHGCKLRWQVTNDPVGFRELASLLRSRKVTRVGLEASGGYERAGAALLETGVTAYLPTLITAPYFRSAVENAIDSWRRVVVTATQLGIPIPGFSSALSYYDALRTERLPAALIQGLRDNFGAHTYHRVDKPGTFHTEWAGDGQEHPA